jgi:hypothetical protein
MQGQTCRMSDAYPARRRNIAARLGIIFAGIAVALSLVFSVAFFLSAVAGVPDFVAEFANASGVVVLIIVPVLCVAGLVFGIVGAVRSGRLGEGAIAVVAICLSALFLIGSVLIIGIVSFLSAVGPELKG